MDAIRDPADEASVVLPSDASTISGDDVPAATLTGVAAPPRSARIWLTVVMCLLVGSVLAAIARLDYVAFHFLAEVAVMVVLGTIFSIAWYTQRLSSSGYLVIMGMAALPIAVVTTLHMLTYRGMPILPGHTADLPTQLWVAARYLTAMGFLVAPAFVARRLPNPSVPLAVFSLLAAVLVAAIFVGLFPSAFVEGQGLTPFKIISEYLIIVAFAVALFLLTRQRAALPRDVVSLLSGSIATAIVAEVLFTAYTDVYGITNMFGHLFYLLSFYLLYLALVDVVLERPYDTLFRELSQREAALREAHRFSEGLNEIDAAINSTLDSSEIFERVVAKAGSIMGADAVVLALFEGDRFRPRYFWGYSGREYRDLNLDRDFGRHIFRAWELGRPVAISETTGNPEVSSELVKATGVRALISDVLLVRDNPVGGLGFHWWHGPHVATPEEIDFAHKVTSSVALALDNAFSYASEHEVAEALQTDMAVAAESAPGVEVGHVYVPAPGPGRIGGDFFDAFALDSGQLAFLIGDVAGRGLSAAVMNAMTRSIVRALAYIDAEPSTVLERAGHTLSHQLEESEFVTAEFGVFDSATGEVRVGIAGHPDPLVLRRPDLVPPDDTRCPPLGVQMGLPCTPWAFRLDPGDVLVLYTDGVIETRRGNEFFGSGRLRGALTAIAEDADAQTVADSVLAAVRDFAGGDVSDDLAILAIKYVGDGIAEESRD